MISSPAAAADSIVHALGFDLLVMNYEGSEGDIILNVDLYVRDVPCGV